MLKAVAAVSGGDEKAGVANWSSLAEEGDLEGDDGKEVDARARASAVEMGLMDSPAASVVTRSGRVGTSEASMSSSGDVL